jgi:hypothetical protein
MADIPFVKVYAAPGIDSTPHEQGVFNSGAGFSPAAPTLKTPPYDWSNEAPSQGYGTERLVGTAAATKAPDATSLKVRRRGVTPWGGFFSGRESLKYQHPGGITDHNAGASALIAGGPGAASSFCRINGNNARDGRRMKLPILPQTVVRGGVASFPAGGGSHEPLIAPLQPKIKGWPTIFSFTGNGTKPAK